MNFEWDERKAKINEVKHGISFDEVTTVFGDPLAITYGDPFNSDAEERFITFGRTSNGKYLVISHTDRESSIRIISGREMTNTERAQYEKN